MKPHRTAKYYYLKFIRLKGDPATLARGVAIGLFIGVTPTIPLHTILVILFAYLLRGNTIAALLTSNIASNPLTFFPQYYLAWRIGNLITPYNLSWERIRVVLTALISDAGFNERLGSLGLLGHEAIIVMLLGGCLLAFPIAVAGYFLSFNFFCTLEKKRCRKKLFK